MPATSNDETHRLLYAFSGSWLTVEGERLDAGHGAVLDSSRPLELVAGDRGVECMVLQGRPIGEPVAQYGPFVMNTQAEIQQAFADYRRTQFGGWPWGSDDPNHGPGPRRFARHADGRVEIFDVQPAPTA
jgi:redox-sensitive bicupin YhaK (pirin superfamily)